MHEFIQRAVASLGIEEDTARSATGGLLALMKEKADPDTAEELLRTFPQAHDLMAASGGGGGLVGGIAKSLGSAIGGGQGTALSVAGVLAGSGLVPEKFAPFVDLLLGFLKEKGSAGLVQRLLGQIPELAKLTGGTSN